VGVLLEEVEVVVVVVVVVRWGEGEATEAMVRVFGRDGCGMLWWWLRWRRTERSRLRVAGRTR
jgi:hypothetical protein